MLLAVTFSNKLILLSKVRLMASFNTAKIWCPFFIIIHPGLEISFLGGTEYSPPQIDEVIPLATNVSTLRDYLLRNKRKTFVYEVKLTSSHWCNHKECSL